MSERRLVEIVPMLLTAQLTLAACGLISVASPEPRQLVIPVENKSAAPARLVVAEAGRSVAPKVEDSIGTADPETVPPGVTQDVVFTVPSGDRWAIYVNPGAGVGTGKLIGARDLPPELSGATPLRILVSANGELQVNSPSGPGWFGN